jgi:pyridinium-3,5-biscarboxylic acid mononucleotide sulfurtransferase
MATVTTLEEIVEACGSIIVAFSGGVDSTLLAVVGNDVLGRDKCLAATGISRSFSAAQEKQASHLAATFDLNWVKVETGELDDPSYVENSTNRCFFCKQELWRHLRRLADDMAPRLLVDGTNADDTHGHRPGAAAGLRAAVGSPLAEAGLTKAMVREEARRRGIPNWQAPASPCLSSRIQYGLPVTRDRLDQVERGEELLRLVGITGDLRLRHRGTEARIEIEAAQFATVRMQRDRVLAGLRDIGFRKVTMDLCGYRSGSLLAEAGAEVEVLAESA